MHVTAIKADAGPDGATKEEIGQFSPGFIWLLRDFYLDLEEDGLEVSLRHRGSAGEDSRSHANDARSR